MITKKKIRKAASLMHRFDRYVMINLMGSFGFFCLVLSGFVLLIQSLQFIPVVVGGQQSIGLFFVIVSLLIPQIMVISLPLAGLCAAFWVLDRMIKDNEWVVILTTGRNFLRMTKGFLIFSFFISSSVAIIYWFIAPWSNKKAFDIVHLVKNDIFSSFIKSGVFFSPIDSVTIFIEKIDKKNIIENITIIDQRDENKKILYSAKTANISKSTNKSIFIELIDGQSIKIDYNKETADYAKFDSFNIDLTNIIPQSSRRNSQREKDIIDIIHTTQKSKNVQIDAKIISELHNRLSAPLYPVAAIITMLGLRTRHVIQRYQSTKSNWITWVLTCSIYALGLIINSLIKSQTAPWQIAYIFPILCITIGLNMLVQNSGRGSL